MNLKKHAKFSTSDDAFLAVPLILDYQPLNYLNLTLYGK